MVIDLNHILKGIQWSTGEDLSAIDPDFLIKTMETRWTSLSLSSGDEYCNYVMEHREEMSHLIYALSNTYTQFFRNALTFATLESIIFPKMIRLNQRQQPIRIWSAGCSTGQEPYSLAMLLTEVMERNGVQIPFRIFATDINEEALSRGRKGFYGKDEVGNLTLDVSNAISPTGTAAITLRLS